MRVDELIALKRDGKTYSRAALCALVDMLVRGEMSDEQVGAWLMAVYLNGMTDAETAALTTCMARSGECLDLSDIDLPMVDKHSTGGVGDKTTLVVCPVLAALGVGMLKLSGRGLGLTGGTLDKLEAIPGLRTDLSIEQAREQVRRIGLAICGHTANLAPADRRLYAIRDTTATIDSIPLIASSILSKKLAGGARRLVLDVKVGRGAFMKTRKRARALAQSLVRLGGALGIQTVAILSDMNEPLGRTVGNALEVREAIEMLRGEPGADRRLAELCGALASVALMLCGAEPEEYERAIAQVLTDGSAARKLAEMIEAQGGDPGVVEHPERLPQASVVRPVLAAKAGFVRRVDADRIGHAAMLMGAGRAQKEDRIDPAVGVVLHKKVGDAVSADEPLADLHLRRLEDAELGTRLVREAFQIGMEAPEARPIVYELVAGV